MTAFFGGLGATGWLPAAVANQPLKEISEESRGEIPRDKPRIVFYPSGGATLICQTATGEVQEPILRRSETELKASATEQVTPAYPASSPEELTKGPGTGAVMVSVLIDEYGKVVSARAMAGNRYPLVEQKAVEAARQWKFTPATMAGRPTKVVAELTFFGQMDRSKGCLVDIRLDAECQPSNC